MLKKISIALLIILILIQFFRPARNISTGPQPMALNSKYAIPENVNAIFKVACYDCHSNNTRYPWYAQIQPVNWYLADHVNEGKRKFNFDEFLSYPLKRQIKKLKEVSETVKEDEMPLTSYILIHQDAKLTPEQKAAIISWADGVRKQVENQ